MLLKMKHALFVVVWAVVAVVADEDDLSWGHKLFESVDVLGEWLEAL